MREERSQRRGARTYGGENGTVEYDSPDILAQVDALARCDCVRVRKKGHHEPRAVRPAYEDDASRGALSFATCRWNSLAFHDVH